MNFCQIAIDGSTTSCYECQEGYGIYQLGNDFKCQANNIPNCKEVLKNGNTSSKIKCTQCNDQFYLEANNESCAPGEVINCKVYNNDKTTCTTCASGFWGVGSYDSNMTPSV